MVYLPDGVHGALEVVDKHHLPGLTLLKVNIHHIRRGFIYPHQGAAVVCQVVDVFGAAFRFKKFNMTIAKIAVDSGAFYLVKIVAANLVDGQCVFKYLEPLWFSVGGKEVNGVARELLKLALVNDGVRCGSSDLPRVCLESGLL